MCPILNLDSNFVGLVQVYSTRALWKNMKVNTDLEFLEIKDLLARRSHPSHTVY